MATDARLSGPTSTAIDKWGNLYISEYTNNCIRKVDTSGMISTLSGTGAGGYSGDGGLATLAELYDPIGLSSDTSGNLYFADCYNSRIRSIRLATASAPLLTSPVGGLAVSRNPSNGAFMVTLSAQHQEPCIISVTNILGQKIAQVMTTTNLSTIVPINGSAGVYILTATTAHTRQSEKVIVE